MSSSGISREILHLTDRVFPYAFDASSLNMYFFGVFAPVFPSNKNLLLLFYALIPKAFVANVALVPKVLTLFQGNT